MQTPPLPQKWPHQKVIVNGAQCSESNGNDNKKNFRFLFFELSSKIGVIFSKNDTKMAITRKIKIGKIWKLVLLSNEPISNLPCKFQKLKKNIKKFASFFCNYVVSELARFGRGRRTLVSTGLRSSAFQNCLPHCFSS